MLDTNEDMVSGRHILHEEQEDNDSTDLSSRNTKLHPNLKPLTLEVRSLWNVTIVNVHQRYRKSVLLGKRMCKIYLSSELFPENTKFAFCQLLFSLFPLLYHAISLV